MELQYFGGNCVKITTKKSTLVVDDNVADLGGKSVARDGDTLLFTGTQYKVEVTPKISINMPGEYEVSGISIRGIAARGHMDEEGTSQAVMYRIVADDIRIAVVGHIYPDLSEDQLEGLGLIDVLVVPVGGHGFTLDPVGALKVIKKIEPKIIVPVQYADKALNYEVPATDLETALKELGMEPKETVDKLKVKSMELFGDQAQLIVVSRS